MDLENKLQLKKLECKPGLYWLRWIQQVINSDVGFYWFHRESSELVMVIKEESIHVNEK